MFKLFLYLAGIAMALGGVQNGRPKTVLLDYYFNNERHRDSSGELTRYHYTWEDRANSGFSIFGDLFRSHGAETDSLAVAPTTENLRKASVYIIVDPDDEREVPHPNYVAPRDVRAIVRWVKAGGVLVLMGNDSANAGLPHFNPLAERFGIHFNDDDYHKVTGDNFAMGAFDLGRKGPIFSSTAKVFIKDLCTLTVRPPAAAYFTDSGHVIMAVAKVGLGSVFAVGDPWFYNEYVNGKRLPPEFENRQAADDLVRWLLQQAQGKLK